MGVAAGASVARWSVSRCVRDRLYVAEQPGDPDGRQHRSQTADADPCLRNLEDAAGLLSRGRSQPAVAGRARTHWRKIRGNPAVASHGRRPHRPRFGTLFDRGGGVAGGEGAAGEKPKTKSKLQIDKAP